MNLTDEVLQHFFCYGEVGDDTIFHGAYRRNVARSPADHQFGLGANGGNSPLAARTTFIPDCHYRWFIQDNTLTTYINQCIRCTQINRKVIGEHAPKPFKKHSPSALVEI